MNYDTIHTTPLYSWDVSYVSVYDANNLGVGHSIFAVIDVKHESVAPTVCRTSDMLFPLHYTI